MYYIPSMNQATKQVLLLENTIHVTHVLHMCPAKWQTQYELTEKMTLVSTRALLLILEKIEKKPKVEAKPPCMIKPKGSEGKCKMESINARIPQKPNQVGLSDKQCALCKKWSAINII